MKNLIYLAILCLPLFVDAQDCEFPVVDGVFELKEVVSVEDAPAKDLYKAGLNALTGILIGKKDRISRRAQSEGIITAKYNVHINDSNLLHGNREHYFKFLLRLEFKDGRYRIIANYVDHQLRYNSGSKICSCPNSIIENKCGVLQCISKRTWKKRKCTAVTELQNTIETLKTQITKEVNDTDW